MEATKDGKLVRQHHTDLTVRISCAEGVRYRVQRMGKDDGRTIRCPSVYVSRHHCEIYRRDKAFWINDLGSSNGTYLNGQKLIPQRERELRFKDIIGMGISHKTTDETITVTDSQCYIFKFLEEDKELEVIDLEDMETEDASSVNQEDEADTSVNQEEEAVTSVHREMGQPIPAGRHNISKKLNSNNSKKGDTDDEIQVLEETESTSFSSSVSNKSISPRRAMPPPPPPPIISEPTVFKKSVVNNTFSAPQLPSKSLSRNRDSSSSGESTSSTRKADERFPPVAPSKILSASSAPQQASKSLSRNRDSSSSGESTSSTRKADERFAPIAPCKILSASSAPQQASKSLSRNRDSSLSSDESTSSTRKADERFPPVAPSKTFSANTSSNSSEVKNKRPLSSEQDQRPVKRTKHDPTSSSGDDSSDGLGDIDENVNARRKNPSSYSVVSSDGSSSEKTDDDSIDEAQPSWEDISTIKKQDKSIQKKKISLTEEKSKNGNRDDNAPLYDISDEDDAEIGRRKYDELKADAIRDGNLKNYKVKLQQIIVKVKGQYNLTKTIYHALNPSSRSRMQKQFGASLRQNMSMSSAQKPSRPSLNTFLGTGSNDDARRGKKYISSSDTEDEQRVNDSPSTNFEDVCDPEKAEDIYDLPEEDFASDDEDVDNFEHQRNSPITHSSTATSETPKSKTGPRSIQLLDSAPLPRFAAKAQSKNAHLKQPLPPSASKNNKVQNHASKSPIYSPSPQGRPLQFLSKDEQKQLRIQKLKEMELKKQQEKEENVSVTPRKTPQAAKIKLTTRNRNQGFLDSMINTAESKNATDTDKAAPMSPTVEDNVETTEKPQKRSVFNPLDPRLTSNSRVVPRDLTLSKSLIKNGASSLPRSSNPGPSKSNFPSAPVSNTRNIPGPNILKPGAQVVLSPPSGIGKVAYREKGKSFPTENFKQHPPAVSEEDIYKRILGWRPAWLEEQKSMKEDPPILNKESEFLTTTLSQYENFDAYFKIYYPLLLSEIWATISNDHTSNKSNGNDEGNRNNFFHKKLVKTTDYKIKIDEATRVSKCMLVNQKPSNEKPSEDENWVNIKYHTCVKKGDIDYRKDLVILTLKGTEKGSGKKTAKKVFGFPLGGSERYDSDANECDVRLRLRGKDGTDGLRYNETIVCKFGSNFVVDKSELGLISRICNITPKLREFRALNTLGAYSLFRKIISPLEDPRNDWQSWINKNHTSGVHEMIPKCGKLNGQQRAVVRCVSSRISSEEPELMLMHGPPGTGKTTTIVALVLQLLVSYQKKAPSRNHRILICTPSNAAIDEIMRRLSHAIAELPSTSSGPGNNRKIEMVRVGDRAGSRVEDDPELKRYAIDSKVEEMEIEKSTAKSIKAEIEAVENEIEDLSIQIDDLKSRQKSDPISLEAKLSRRKEKVDRKKTLVKDYDTVMNKGRSSKDEAQLRRSVIIERSQIVCSTLSASSTSVMKAFAKRLPHGEPAFLCCIVDEASQTTEPETLLPLVLKINKLLLVGDPHQLGATVLSSSANEKKYGQSLFSRHFEFYSRKKSSNPVMTLIRQYRMHSEIAKWPNIYFYDSKLQTDYKPPVQKYPLRPYYFLNLSAGREHSSKEGQRENADEVAMVKALLDTIDDMLIPLNTKVTIGVITPYTAQKQSIRNEVKDKTYRSFHKLSIDTVDGFQGQEKDIIIFSTVRTDGTGFLKSRNRLNVALTRAKHSLYIIGDARCLSQENMWKCLVKDAAECNNKFEVNPDFRNDLKLLKLQLCNNLKQK